MKIKIRHIVLLTLILSFGRIQAQESFYSQFYNTPTFYNPAYTGYFPGLKVRINYRNQWPQYTNDLKTYNFSMDLAERAMPGAGGLGIIFNTNKEGSGYIKRSMIGLMGSARIKHSRYLISQFGFTAAYVQKQIDANDFIFSDQLDDRHGLYYPVSSFVGFHDEKVSYPDLSLGGLVNYKKRYVSATFGFAVHHVFKPNESFSNLDMRVPRRYVVHTDFVILQQANAKKGFRFNPAFLFENQAGFNTFTVGMNTSKSVLYVGAWYRNKQSLIYDFQSLILTAGLKIPMVNEYSRMKLMYSYDLSLTSMKGSGGAHEISLKFEFDLIHLVRSSSYFAKDYPVITEPLRF
jgi:type IX secretion system PorP/SprF family membrane protein